MTGYPHFWALVKHDLSFRRERITENRPGRRRWYTLASLVAWIAVVTWQGPNVHFNLNYAWYATWALPVMAIGVATGHIAHERKNGTAGWWLALPVPRWKLLLSKLVASGVLIVRGSAYLGMVAGLGIYTMWLNGTLSSTLISHFLLVGLTWTAAMYCLIPLTAATGVLMGVLDYSRLKDLSPAVWVLVVAAGWLAVAQHGWYLTVSTPLVVTLKATFGLVIAAAGLIATGVLWLSARILKRSSGM